MRDVPCDGEVKRMGVVLMICWAETERKGKVIASCKILDTFLHNNLLDKYIQTVF
jgi:hypothetical protein